MARRGRPPKKKKQASITAFTSKGGGGRGGGRGKTKKNDVVAEVPTSRTWVYAASSSSAAANAAAADAADGNNGRSRRGSGGNSDGGIFGINNSTEEGYEHYLHQRVQRPVVRSLPGNFSYFQPEQAAAAGAVGEGGEADGDVVALKLEGGGSEKILPNTLSYTHVPLPPLIDIEKSGSTDTSATAAAQTNSSKFTSNAESAAYSKFTAPIITKDTRLAKFQYGLNYGTHVPERNLISYVGSGSNTVNTEEDSGYVLQLPLVYGTVIGYSPPLEDGGYGPWMEENDDGEFTTMMETEVAEFETSRQKEDMPLFRVLWDGHSNAAAAGDADADDGTNGNKEDTTMMGYIEDVTLPELLSCLTTTSTTSNGLSSKQRLNHKKTLYPPYNISNPTTSLTTTTTNPTILPSTLQTTTASSIHKKTHATTTRKQLSLEWKLEHTILPTLVVLAARELRKEVAFKVRMELLLERRRLRMESGLDGSSSKKKKKKRGKKKGGDEDDEEEEVANENGADFGYYKKHPNQYMSSFVPPPPVPEDEEEEDDDDGDDVEDYLDGDGIATGGGGGGTKPRSKTRLTKSELETYHQKLESYENTSASATFAPSKIAERAKLACSLAYDYVYTNGLLDEYYAESVRRKELEREERERLGRTIHAESGGGGGGSGGSGGRGGGGGGGADATATGEVRRSSRARTTVNYTEDGTREVEQILNDHEGKKSSGGSGAGGAGGSLPRENVAGGPTARYLLGLLGMLPEDDHGEAEAEEGAEEGEEIDEAAEDDDDTHEEEEVTEDPFFEPSPHLIIDQLGRKHRYMSPASIQAAIVRSIEESNETGFEPIDTPKCLLDEEEVEEMEKHHHGGDGDHDHSYYVTDLICTTGDKVSDLGQFEPMSFARCRFAPRTYVPESEDEDDDEEMDDQDEGTNELSPAQLEAIQQAQAIKLQRKIARRTARAAARTKKITELERRYRQQKSYELWRFKCIHGNGCTMFPSWSRRVGGLLGDLFSDSVGGGEQGMAAVTAVKSGGMEPAGSSAAATAAGATGTTASDAGAETVKSSTPADPSADPSAATTATTTQSDEQLARSIAAAEAAAEAGASSTTTALVDEPLAKRRRTRRAGGIESEPVFYGGYQSMSRDQLLETLVRLLHQATTTTHTTHHTSTSNGITHYGSSSLMDLKRLVYPENYDTSRGGIVEMKKLRSALGHLVYKLGRIGRLVVDVRGDEECWEIMNHDGGVGGGALVKFVGEEDGTSMEVVSGAATVDGVATAANVGGGGGDEAVKGNEEPKEEEVVVKPTEAEAVKAEPAAEDATGDTEASAAAAAVAPPPPVPPVPTTSSAPPPPAMDPHLKTQLLSLEQYIANLHRTELSLRRSLMKAIDKGSSSSGSSGGDGGSGGTGGETLLQISTRAIATASDEVEGSADAEDWHFFIPKKNQNGDAAGEEAGANKDIKWSSSDGGGGGDNIKINSHPLIGQVIYRPQSSPLRPDDAIANEKCHWYRIVSYTPSIIRSVEDITSESAAIGVGGGQIVERRMRFRAVPVAESDIDAPFDTMMDEDSDDDEEDMEYMILTEGQARAGMEAAMLHRRIERKWTEKKKKKKKKSLSSLKEEEDGVDVDVGAQSKSRRHVAHPLRNGHGSRVMLTPKPNEKKGNGSETKLDILYGVIAGYDIHPTETNGVVKNKLLILLENAEEENKSAADDDDGNSNLKKKKKSLSFWSTVVDDPEEGTFLTDIVTTNTTTTTTQPSLCTSYTIEMHEYYQGSPAYNVCESIVSYLKSHSKSGPFLEPVDPIALGIPDYPTVVTQPMDISTLGANLKEGRYSRIPPKATAATNDEDEEEDGTNTPVYRMAYGPFYDAIMLIFDNCVKYNGETSWVGNEAIILKKNVVKKIQQVVSKALWQGGGGGGGGYSKLSSSRGASSSRGGGAAAVGIKSLYTEDDSDVDMYEYESEYDDEEFGGGGKRKSRKKGGNKSKSGGGGARKHRSGGKEDISSKAIEQPFEMPENAHEFGTAWGAFPHLKVQTIVGKFSLSQEWWSCRYIEDDDNSNIGRSVGDDDEKDEGAAAEEEDAMTTTAEDEMLMLMQLQQEEDANSGAPMRRSARARHAPKNYADDEIVSSSGVGGGATNSSSGAQQRPVTLPGVEYYLTNDSALRPPKKKKMVEGEEKEEGGGVGSTIANDTEEEDDDTLIPTICRSRLGAEGVQETLHELFYAKLYREHSPNAFILDSGLGKYVDGSFPPYLGRVNPATPPTSTDDDDDDDDAAAIVWEIREQYLIPALRWVLRGLVRSGHLAEVDGTLSEGILDDAPARTSFGAGIVVPSHEYYYNEGCFPPFDVLDEKEILRKRRLAAAAAADSSSSEDEVEMSEYEKMRAARVARNAERLKALGLA